MTLLFFSLEIHSETIRIALSDSSIWNYDSISLQGQSVAFDSLFLGKFIIFHHLKSNFFWVMIFTGIFFKLISLLDIWLLCFILNTFYIPCSLHIILFFHFCHNFLWFCNHSVCRLHKWRYKLFGVCSYEICNILIFNCSSLFTICLYFMYYMYLYTPCSLHSIFLHICHNVFDFVMNLYAIYNL